MQKCLGVVLKGLGVQFVPTPAKVVQEQAYVGTEVNLKFEISYLRRMIREVW